MPASLPTSPVDGIALPPEPDVERAMEGTSPSVPPPPKPRKATMAVIVLFVIAVLYASPGLVLLGLFPRPDGSMEQVKLMGTALYALGGLLWVLFGIVGFSRIMAIKEHPRMRFFGLLRLVVVSFPMILLSIAVPLMINTQPRLSLAVLSPTSQELIAPVTVSFGMPTALQFFQSQNLVPLKYEWDFNSDGTTDQETFDPQSTSLFSGAGVHTVLARVTMTNGEQKNVVGRVIIPRASFGLEPLAPIVDEPTTFTLEHLFPVSAETAAPKLQKAKWDFDGDGVPDLETDKLTALFTYRKLGKVNANVVVTLTNQSQATFQRVVDVQKPVEQPFPITMETEPQMLLGPPPFGVVFVLKTQEKIASATWDFGNQRSGQGLRVAQVFGTVGTFGVTATVRSASGAVAKLSKVVRITNPLEIRDLSFTGKPAVQSFTIEGQIPLHVDITPVTQQPLITFSWDAPSASEIITTDRSFQAVYRDEGRYSVDLIGMDTDQNVFRKSITIVALPPQSVVTFSMDPSTPTAPALVKFDASDTFVPQGEEITGFEWDFGDGESTDNRKFSGSRIDHRFNVPGTYTITLTVRTTSGKVFTGRQTLVVRAPLIDVCFLPSRRTGSAPLGVRFDTACSTGEFTSWLWDFGDGSQSDQDMPTHVFLNADEYTVTLTATTKGGLKATKTTTISVSSQ